jgi:hypothetical protein
MALDTLDYDPIVYGGTSRVAINETIVDDVLAEPADP